LKKKIISSAILFIAILLGGFFYFRHQVYFSQGTQKNIVTFEIKKGEGNEKIATGLEGKGVIASRYYFYYYVKMSGLSGKIMPGDYLLSGKMTVPEVVHVITNPEEQVAKITFPEGFTSEDMAEVLEENGFDEDGFLSLVNNPTIFRKRYAFLTDPAINNLEGYLFPDTYFFKKDLTSEQIISKMLDDFSTRVSDEIMTGAKRQGKTLREVIIMASIVEKEVASTSDMRTVSGIFWNRITDDMPLQSDAPLSYILGDNKDQHSIEETKIDSPYNTYKVKGLPPGPISNPGLNAIQAAVNPEKTDYTFFFTIGKGAEKKTIYSKTFEEHVSNRTKYGI